MEPSSSPPGGVQESFDGLPSLKQLVIDWNRVEEIQPGAFSQLGFLNLLSLTHNQLVYIPNMAFQVHARMHTHTRTCTRTWPSR